MFPAVALVCPDSNGLFDFFCQQGKGYSVQEVVADFFLKT